MHKGIALSAAVEEDSGRIVVDGRRLHGYRIAAPADRRAGAARSQGPHGHCQRHGASRIWHRTLIDAKLVRTLVVSHIGTNPETQRQMIAGEIEVDLVPQGTLAERIRAAGYGLGRRADADRRRNPRCGRRTVDRRRRQDVPSRRCPFRPTSLSIGAHRADYLGNLSYALTARNFNPLMAMAATTVVAEAAEIVPVGVIPPDDVITPGRHRRPPR